MRHAVITSFSISINFFVNFSSPKNTVETLDTLH